MAYTKVRGPDIALPERGPRGLQGNKPPHEIDEANYRIRWENPDGSWGDWLDIGAMAAEEASAAAASADASAASAAASANSAIAAEGYANDSADSAADAAALVEAADAGFGGFASDTAYDFGFVTDTVTYFDQDFGELPAA